MNAKTLPMGKDKKFLISVFKRCIEPSGRIVFLTEELQEKEIFRGLAKDWRKSGEKEFQEMAKQNGIGPYTSIAVAEKKPDVFVVIKV
jgi:hypothetical protein